MKPVKASELQGITFDGVPVEDLIDEEETDEKTKKEVKEVRKEEQKKPLYHDPLAKAPKKIRYMDKKAGRVYKLTRAEINKEYWRDNMKSAKNILTKIMALMLTGEKYSVLDFVDQMKDDEDLKDKIINQSNIATRITKLMRSELGRVIIRTPGAGKGGQRAFLYEFSKPACNLQIEQAYQLYDNRVKNKVEDFGLIAHGIDYETRRTHKKKIAPAEPKKPIVKKARRKIAPKAKRIIPEDPVVKREAKKAIKQFQADMRILQDEVVDQISRRFGLEINVSGRIDFVFKFEK